MDKYPDLKKINGYNQIQVRNTVFNCEINNHGVRATIQDHLKISINKAIIQVHLKISINKAIIQDHQKISNNKANSAIILEYLKISSTKAIIQVHITISINLVVELIFEIQLQLGAHKRTWTW